MKTEFAGGVLKIYSEEPLGGKNYKQSAKQLAKCLKQSSSFKSIVFVGSQLDPLDSISIAILVGLANECTKAGCRLRLESLSEATLNLLKSLRLEKIMDFSLEICTE